jgi:hypothetical protein
MGRSNLTVVADAEKNPTPWKRSEGGLVPGGSGWEETARRHPAGSALRVSHDAASLIRKLQENSNDSIRARLRNMHAQAIAELEGEMEAIVRQHEAETLLLDYRLAGHTLEGLGDLADDEVVEAAWGRLSDEFEL